MKFKKSLALAAVGAALVAMIVPLSSSAGAATTPPWEPDGNSEGSITFYNSTGAVVTSGTNLAHLFDYAAASSAGRPGTTRATLSFGFPDHTKPDTSTWFQSSASASTIFPNTSAPAPINGFTNPVVSVGAADANLSAVLGSTTLDTTPGYLNLVQIRVKDSGPGIPIQDTPFWSTDISFDQTAGTWTQVYPPPASGPTTTTTTLGVAPASPQVSGTTVTLTATLSPSNAAGTVQFKDGTTNIGSAVTVSSGTAQTTTSTLSVGTHSLTAAFTPTDSTKFTASTSSASSYTITAPATATTTTLGITPPSPITVGTTSTLTATVSPSSAAGTVQFLDGASNIGSPVTVASGTASTTTTFTVNTHSVQAKFTPTDPSAFQPSQSAAQSYVVNAASATPTTTTLGITPPSPQTFGTTLNLTGTVSPSTAVGSVQFLDGTVVVGSGTVTGGVATATTSTLDAGGHSIVASFVPTDSTKFAASQSAAASYLINPKSTTTTLAVTPTGPVTQGATITLKATVAPTAAPGSVQFLDGTTDLGSPVTVASGVASMNTTTLSVATHSLTAVFTSTSNDYGPSTSNAVSLEVDKAPPQTTTTTLGVTPSSPATTGTVETLTATVSPTGAAGTVQFTDGTTNINAPVTVSGGTATTTTTLALGSHSLKASFTSADVTSFTSSASGSLPYTVQSGPVSTTTALTVTPPGPVTFGTAVTLTGTVTPSSAAGTIQFLDGTKQLAIKPVSSGSASVTVVLGGGTHTLTANFTPTNAAAFTASSSTPATLKVNPINTVTALAVSPHGPILETTKITMTATVTPSTVAGSVTFYVGTRALGTVPLSKGSATLSTNKLFGGRAVLTATFTGAPAVDFASSTSAPVTLFVIGLPKLLSARSDGVAVPSGATLQHGQPLTLLAAGFAPGEQVSVVAHSTPVMLGATHAQASGDATTSVTIPDGLPAGSHTITLSGAHGAAVFAFVIAAPAANQLASTGTDLRAPTLLGLVLLVTGLFALGAVGPRRWHRGDHRM